MKMSIQTKHLNYYFCLQLIYNLFICNLQLHPNIKMKNLGIEGAL